MTAKFTQTNAKRLRIGKWYIECGKVLYESDDWNEMLEQLNKK